MTPWTAARQAPLPMAFSRQAYWSGLPCSPPGGLPGPGTEPCLMSPALAGRFLPLAASEKLMKVEVTQSRLTLQPQGLYSPWNSPGRKTGVGSLSLLQGNLPNPGIEPRSPALWADSLPAEPPGTPKNAGVGRLFILQWVCLTQESPGVSPIAGGFFTS